ncbi:DUF2336 domain-containing protein [Kiloniella sp. b19]|uniref:DUF2336 domain-containing protein n=1 Tax=Kiloniella sp. GXU_MW_B19 TaxID=3141326 RepID=UPI0031D601CA
MSLSASDVAKLLSDPSADNRVETTKKIATHFDEHRFSEAEREIAEDIFRALVKDAEVRVREAIAVNLQNSTDLPRDVAVALAKDVDSVSLPVLKSSEVLTDEDLISILNGQSESKASAIAQRPQVSDAVSSAVIDTGHEMAVAHLVSNEGADLNEQHFERVSSEFEASELVNASMTSRPSLPPAVASKLMTSLSERLENYFKEKMALSSTEASSLVLQVRERATVTLLEEGSSDNQLAELVRELYNKGELTASLLLRAICNGDFRFFEFALARLAGIPLMNAHKLIYDKGGLGIQALIQKCGLPNLYYPAIFAAVELLNDMDYDGESNDRARFNARLIERVITKFDQPESTLTEEDADFLLNKLKMSAV